MDANTVLEAGPTDSGKWIVAPTPPYTGDGIHPNAAGYTLVQNAAMVPNPVYP